MKGSIRVSVAALAAIALSVTAPVSGQAAGQEASSQQQQSPEPLDVYTATVTPEQAAELSREGVDIVSQEPAGLDLVVDAVLTDEGRDRLQRRTGVDMQPKRNAEGLTQREAALQQAANGFSVWRSWDDAGGIRDELNTIADQNRNIVKKVVLGTTYGNREIVALKVTQDARKVRDGSRRAVLYVSLQHAREWITVEVNRRLLHYFIDGWRANDREIRNLLRDTELWFVIVANPDGYEYTFDFERLWRKNLRDNNGNEQIAFGDGVDLNRNFDEHWGYDEEGSSSQPASDTYRGPAPASEPETQAMQGLIDLIRPRLMTNWHSAANQILYPQGWQVGTLDGDNPIYTALAGTDAQPAIPGFDPGPSADELYVTNGETTDYADVNAGTIAFTVELGEGELGAGFVFPDDEALIQAEFEKTLNYSLGLARSADRPDDPDSPVGIDPQPFYLDQAEIDPENGPLSMFDFSFEVSYGDPQEVRVLANRRLGDVTANFKVNGGPPTSVGTAEWTVGETYGVGNARWYHVMSGEIAGTNPGDVVEVWFEGGGQSSASFTYTAVSETGNPLLVLAAEDYTGASPVYTNQAGPSHLSFYTSALAANGVAFDVYDVDANARTAPDPLGVLSHYDGVVWYTGNDVITREPGWGAGNASSLAMTELLSVRDFLNEGGRVLYTGKYAGHQYTTGHGTQMYDPFENAQCTSNPAILARCRPLPGSGNLVGDVLEYWFGSGLLNEDAGTNHDTDPANLFDVFGVDEPLAGLEWGFNGTDSAQNQDHSASFITTSGLLPVDQYPQFASWVAARYDRPGGPFDPHSGQNYVYSGISDIAYKRLTRTIMVPAGGASLSFWVSFNTELDWDYFFVEARTPGQEDWTTLPVAGQTSQDTGDSCPAGWNELHPHLDHYQTLNPDETCTPTGTTGAWHAASGSSSGWQQWTVDLSAYAVPGQVEISLAYASDWATQGLGVFIDDITVSTGEGTTDFETDLGGWEVTGPPEGSASNLNNFERITGAGFPEAAVVATDDTLLMGFGFEGISDAATREEVMGRAVDYLLRPADTG